MSNHQQIPEDIRKQINDLENKLGGIDNLVGKSKEQALQKHQKQLKRIRRLLGTYQSSIQSGAFSDTASHKSQFQEFQFTLGKLEKQIDISRQNTGSEEELFKHKPKSNKNMEMEMGNRQAVVQRGNQGQKQSEEALIRIQQHIGGMDAQANQMLIELDRQISSLDGIYDKMNDTQTTLKRAQQHLRYFGRQVYADRCLIVVIIIIAVAILVIIGLAIAGKTPQQQSSQVN